MNNIFAMREEAAIAMLEAIENATAEQHAQAVAQYGNQKLPDNLSFSDDGKTAAISITGALQMEESSFIARLFGFGGTSYKSIIESADLIAGDPAISTVRLMMNTPGGRVDGMDQARQAIEALVKSGRTVIAENHGQICSAGYHLASSASKIIAMSPMAATGSIGVIIAGVDSSGAMEKQGYKKFSIVSRNAPDKNPDPTSNKGMKLLQEQADAYERLFIDAVAKGRKTTAEDVIANFGKGGILLAKDPDKSKPSALSVGMIDAVVETKKYVSAEKAGFTASIDNKKIISQSDDEVKTIAGSGATQKGKKMDINELKAAHPALYAAAVADGVAQERERVLAHTALGEASDMMIALQNIKDGSGLTASAQAAYMAASMAKYAKDARASDNVGDVQAAAATASADEAELSKMVAERLGVAK